MSESGTAVGQVLAMRLSLDLFSVAVGADEKVVCLDFCLGKVLRCLQEDWLGVAAAGSLRWAASHVRRRRRGRGSADLQLFQGKVKRKDSVHGTGDGTKQVLGI